MLFSLRKSLTQKLVFLFVITTIIPIIIAGSLTFNLASESLEKENFSKLDSIALLKVKTIESIFGEIKSDTILAQKYLNVRINLPILSQYYKNIESTNYVAAHKELDSQLHVYLNEKTLVDDIILLDEFGMFVYQTNHVTSNWFGKSFPFIDPTILESAKIEQKFTKIMIDESYKSEPTMFSVIAVYGVDNRFVGYFVLDLNMQEIFDLIQDTTGLGNTGETLLGIKEGNFAVFINPLRYDPDASFSRKISLDDEIARPIREAVQGKEGADLTIDYRPIPIIAVWKYIPSLDWGIVAKIDQAEMFSPINSLYQSNIMLAIVFTLLVGVIGFVASRNITAPIIALKNKSDKIRKGIYEKPLKVRGVDELASFTKSFNQMSDDLFESRMNLEHFKKGLDHSALVAITDESGTISYANQKFCDISKYSQEELIGTNHRILKSGFHPDKFYEDLWKTISSGSIWQGDIKNKAKDGTFYWVQSTIIPLVNKNGKILQYLAIRFDITSQKNQTEQLIKSERMSSIGEVSSSMAHNIRNPLTSIKNSFKIIKNQLPAEDAISKKEINRIDNSISKIVTQLDHVLNFVRSKPLKKNLHKTNEFFDQSIKDIIPKHIQFTIPENNVTVNCDLQKIQIIITNLITNSIQSIGKIDGIISVEISEDQNNFILSVKDSGPGIPEDKLDKIFEPLFTTKLDGTGLGLASCKNIIEQHGGIISVKNNPTIFSITLPKNK